MFDKTKKAAKTDDVEHPKPFAYRIGDNVRPFLQPDAYIARELLNCTVASFYELRNSKLTPHQREAKMDFIELFERQAKIPLKDLDDSDLNLHNTLTVLMKYLDEFFFFGSLTHGSPSLIRKLALRDFSNDTAIGLCEFKRHGKELYVCEISIDKGQANLAQMVYILIHEMVHAYLGLFACRCNQCIRNDFNAVGFKLSSHGPIFRGMHYATTICMADWSEELDIVFRDRTDGTYIHADSLSLEKRALEKAKQSGVLEDMAMRPYIKNPSPRLLIRTSENSISVDVERLRANVQRTAASVSNMSAKPVTTRRQRKKVPSVKSESLDDWSDTDSEEQKHSMFSSEEDSEMDWSTEESMCIYCTTSTHGIPITKGEHKASSVKVF